MGIITTEERDHLRGHLRAYVESITEPSKSGKYVCPLCSSGKGRHKTGAFSVTDNGDYWKCFSCGESGDIFDLIARLNGLDPRRDYPKAVQLARAFAGYDTTTITPPKKAVQEAPNCKQPKAAPPEEAPTNYRPFLLRAAKDIDKTTYHRGISIETLQKYGVGYVAEWKHPNRPNDKASARLIIPTSDYSYTARATTAPEYMPPGQAKVMKVGKTHLFNAQALQTAKAPIWITEGEIDALSIIDAGGEAVGLGGVGQVHLLLKAVQETKPVQPLVVNMDSDEAGMKACKELVEGLTAANIPFHACFFDENEGKDANEALTKDRATLIKNIEHAGELAKDDQTEEREEYLRTSTAGYLQAFVDDIQNNAGAHAIPTGFNKLDEVLDGGLYDGLYIVGAISSLGKTTLISQIGDNIAKDGRDVLIFSLEMARTELMSRSISRHTLEITLATGGEVSDAKTALGISVGSRYRSYSERECKLIKAAIGAYGEYANHIYIKEGLGDIGANQIRAAVERHISLTGNTPVVIVDYLQLLAPYNDRSTDKQNMDKAVMELKRISRDAKTPVIAISSFNRASYSTPVAMEAFKESGAIEYSSDVLIGLQLKGAGGSDFDANEAKRRTPREIELVILKNRKGRVGDKLELSYQPLFNYFEEV